MSELPLPLPAIGEPAALFYTLGYIAAFENVKAKNPFAKTDGRKTLSYELWQRGNVDGKLSKETIDI